MNVAYSRSCASLLGRFSSVTSSQSLKAWDRRLCTLRSCSFSPQWSMPISSDFKPRPSWTYAHYRCHAPLFHEATAERMKARASGDRGFLRCRRDVVDREVGAVELLLFVHADAHRGLEPPVEDRAA